MTLYLQNKTISDTDGQTRISVHFENGQAEELREIDIIVTQEEGSNSSVNDLAVRVCPGEN